MTGPAVLRGGVPCEAAPAAAPVTAPWTDALFVLGMLTMPLEFVQVGIAQPGQMWMLVALPALVLQRRVRLSRVEATCFVAFIAYAAALTFLEGYPRIKAGDQLFKFAVLYPGFYCAGRGFGAIYARRPPPVGYVFLALLLAGEILVQSLSVPYLYQEVDFAFGVLHGTFKERNWIAMYFFMYSYFLIEFRSAKGVGSVAVFVALNAVVTYFTQSKTIIVACGIVVLARSRLPVVLKVSTIVLGACLYWQFFSGDLSDDVIRDRLEDERGLAYDQSLLLLSKNVLGYGFGFVEGYFSQIALVVQGLGEGTNSVFSVPLDLTIIGGVVGLGVWLVYFCGVGLGATTVLAPIAALSLLNPLHQSDLVYFFIGMLVSGAHHRRDRAAPAPA